LNKVTGGWQPGDLILLAARPSMGKTAVSLLFAKFPAIAQNKTILYFSLEMPEKRLADRIMSLETTINSQQLQTNSLNSSEWSALFDVCDKYYSANFLINDKSGLTVEEIKNFSIIESRKQKVDLIIIDYIGLIKHSLREAKSTNEQLTHISKNLKQLAKKLEIPVIALSQLNRSVDSRSGDKRPFLSDLRDSGALEQDADLVLFLYRNEYYFPDNFETKNQIEVIAAKNRNGEIGTTFLYKNDNWSYLSDKPYDEYYSENIPEF
jgi:replicative DNA helicase